MMISWQATIMLCLCVFSIAVNTAGYAFLPEKHPFNWFEVLGWVAAIVAVLLWEAGR